mgnify:CR=1 FL=1
MNISLPDSRKLTGLIITLCALLVLLIVAVVCSALFSVDNSLFQSIGGFITSLGGAHQGAQMMADRSPNYQSPTVSKTIASPPPPGVDKAATLG